MKRLFALAILTLACSVASASSFEGAQPPPPPIIGVVADPTGAIVPGAEITLLDEKGDPQGSFHSSGDGSFNIVPPHTGNFTLVISEPGFDTVKTPVVIAASAAVTSAAKTPLAYAAPLHIVLPIAALSTNVQVNADSNEDLTSTDDNHDSSVLTSNDLKSLPIFDNDMQGAMSAFLDDAATGTGGSGLIVDGVESNRNPVSASSIQEIRINQDPYSAQYYWPGRGQMEIITKSAADKYHGEFNFIFRDSAMNAQNALAPSKPAEQRRVYEGHIGGPVFFAKNSSFLASFNRAEEDVDALIYANVVPTADNPSGFYRANVPAPTRDTDFSLRAAHQFSDRHSGYVQYAYQEWTGQNQGIGGHTLMDAGYNHRFHEDDFVAHLDSTLSPVLVNQLSVIGEHDSSLNSDLNEAPHIGVSGYFSTGSAQGDALSTEYNFRIFDRVAWTHGKHFIKMGIGVPHLSRRAYDDHTSELGSYTFSPTIAPDGTVVASAIQNYLNNRPSAYAQHFGQVRFIYHQQEAGAFIQDQYKVSNSFSITPGLRYDWQNFLAEKRLAFSPRVSFAWVLDQNSKLVVRGGGGIYYDRFGSGPILDLVRYEGVQPRRRDVTVSLNPAAEPPNGCVPVSNCVNVAAQPVVRDELAPNPRLPYQIQYGLSIERALGEKATIVVSAYSMRDIGRFRSVDINAPTPQSGYTQRPDPAYSRIRQMQPAGFMNGNAMDVTYRGRYNKWFTGWGRYTWSHYGNNTDSLWFYPQNQYAPNDEWAPASFDRRQRLGMYAMFHPDSIWNLSTGIWANSGGPWTPSTGTDPYGDNLFNARPDGVARNSQRLPSNTNLDVRWGHDFAFTANKADEAPHIGFSVSSFNVINHVNTWWVNTVVTAPDYGKIASAGSPRRLQLGMRLEF